MVHIQYNECGHDNWVLPKQITSGCGCGICRPSKRLTTEYVKEFISNQFNGYELLSEYTNQRCHLKIRHRCGCVFDVAAETIITRKNCHCPRCTNKNHNCFPGINDIATTDPWMFDLLVDKEFGTTHKSESHKMTVFKCPSCGEVVNQKPCSVLLYGVNCPKCKTSISYPEK